MGCGKLASPASQHGPVHGVMGGQGGILNVLQWPWKCLGCRICCTRVLIGGRIRGLKVSKSLKNYTTVRTVLSQNYRTARSLPIYFLLMP